MDTASPPSSPGPVSLGGAWSAFALALSRRPPGADTLAPRVAIPRVAPSSSLGRQVAFSPTASAGPCPAAPRRRLPHEG
eukprot:1237028-Prymnesium_polylepis.1